MPKKLKTASSERIDQSDFEYGTSGYALSVSGFDNKNITNGNLAQFLTGFHIQLLDQVANPGQISIYNGKFINSQGILVTNEDSPNASQTITLSGTNQTFYLEVQLVDTLSDVDDRAIWDPTVDNGVGTLPGKEFIESLATRTTQSWSVVSPVSTTSFELSSNANSLKIPLAILKTDALGRITSSVNTGLIAIAPGAFNIEAINISDIRITTTDITTFLGTGSITVSDGVNTEVKTIANIDRANSTITVTVPFANSFSTGARIDETGTNRFFIVERRPSDLAGMTGGTSTHPDKKRKLFSGDESKGKALLKSVGSSLGRDDLGIRHQSDQTDYIASLIREMKFGTPGVGDLNPVTSFPSGIFTSKRYYDFAGSIMGAKEATFTIGDGFNSLGDFNGTTHQVFNDAITAAVLTGQNAVRLVVKPGTYTFTSTVSTTIGVLLEGAASPFSTFDCAEIVNSANTNALFSTSNVYFGVKNIKVTTSIAGCNLVNFTNTIASILYYDMLDCTGTVSGRVVSNSGANVLKVNINNCALSSSNLNDYLISAPSSGVLSGSIANSTFVNSNTSSVNSLIFGFVISSLKIDNCQISYAGSSNIITNNVANADFSVTSCILAHTGVGSSSTNNAYCINLGNSSLRTLIQGNSMVCSNSSNYVKFVYIAGGTKVSINDNKLQNTGAAGGLGANNSKFIHLTDTVSDVSISNNTISIISNAALENNTSAAIGAVSAAIFNLNIRGNSITVDRDASCIYGTSNQYNTVNVDSNQLAGGTNGCSFNESVEPSAPQLSAGFPCINVTNNSYNGKAGPAHVFHVGFLFNRLRGYTSVSVVGNTIENLSGEEASGIRFADYQLGGLVSLAGVPTSTVANNRISRIVGSTYANGITCPETLSRFSFSGNKITFIVGPETYGIYVDSAQEIVASNNSITYVVGTTSGGTAMAIRIADVASAIIESNYISNIGDGGTITSGTVHGIRILSATCNINNNTIKSVYTASSLGNNNSAIRLDEQCDNSVVSNNNIFQSGYICLYLLNQSGSSCDGVVIKGNNIQMHPDSPLGIVLSGTTSNDVITAVAVTGNVVRNYTTGTGSGAIYFNRCRGITISGNMVFEANSPTASDHDAMSLYTCEDFSITGNSFVGNAASSSTNRNAIRLNTNCARFSISGNTCMWANDTSTGGAELRLNNSNYGTITGNVFQGSTNTGVRYAIHTGTAFGVGITGNHFRGTNSVDQIEDSLSSTFSDTSDNPSLYNLNSAI